MQSICMHTSSVLKENLTLDERIQFVVDWFVLCWAADTRKITLVTNKAAKIQNINKSLILNLN